MSNDYDELHELMAKHDLLSLFEKLTFRQRLAKVLAGLRAPKESGDYKYARLQVARLSAPLCALLVPLIAVGLLSFMASIAPQRSATVEVQIVEPEALDDLQEIEELDQEPIEPPEPIEIDNFTPDVSIPSDVQNVVNAPPTESSPQPAAFDAVALVKSPVIMRGIVGNRSAGMRGQALQQFGGSGVTEGAVIRALRWLKSEQRADGSWEKNKVAMTSLALLTFLAHGETPASEEFGETVEKAIRFLVAAAEKNGGRFGGNYEIPIGTYAVCEAYALTRVPMLKPVCEKSVDFIIRGQHPTGGWDYRCNPNMDKREILKETDEKTGKVTERPNPMFNRYRDDTSYMGWCVQALKAAKMAGVHHPQLDEAMTLAIKGFQQNSHPNGGFGYTGPGRGGLTGVGVLCMQFLGAARELECRKGLSALDEIATIDWSKPWLPSPVYYWYYATQAKFHAGGGTWAKWNERFSRELVAAQTVVKGAGEDGKDLGYWDSPSENEHHDGRVQDTTLCALQLQVYYRYLPTFKTPKQLDEDEDIASEVDDIEIDITI